MSKDVFVIRGGSNGPTSAGVNNHDRFIGAVTSHNLVGSKLVESCALGDPSALAILEDRRGEPPGSRPVEVGEFQINPDKRQKVPRQAVSSPEDFIMPASVLPTKALDRIARGEGRDETRFQPFAVLVKCGTGLVGLKVFQEKS
jgi:hypothetical protein